MEVSADPSRDQDDQQFDMDEPSDKSPEQQNEQSRDQTCQISHTSPIRQALQPRFKIKHMSQVQKLHSMHSTTQRSKPIPDRDGLILASNKVAANMIGQRDVVAPLGGSFGLILPELTQGTSSNRNFMQSTQRLAQNTSESSDFFRINVPPKKQLPFIRGFKGKQKEVKFLGSSSRKASNGFENPSNASTAQFL